ncbi:MAG TPA: amidohydrolase family protein [Gemmatimonadales bacterium]|jgi:imidazolonepropionase-like amidohydrolase|nr:amidohydrolase family protein [Gemmatimonadales bacterium]
MRQLRFGPLVALTLCPFLPSSAAAQRPVESFAVANNGPTPLAMGTTKGERYHRLIIRGATVLSGRGSPGTNRAMPPEGPVDIVIENGMIVDMVPMDPVNAAGYGQSFQRPTGDKIVDARGMYVMPGLVEMHAHLPPGQSRGPRGLEYAYRLYLGHGVTIVRDAGSGAGIKLLAEQRRLSEANALPAPRLVLCQRWPLPLREWDVGNTPEKARVMVREFKALGADCLKISKSPGHYPDVMEAAVDEGKKLGMFTMVDLKVSETDARVASNAGVKSIEHWYGIPDAALTGSQNFPTDYNYWKELDRFRYAGMLWSEADKDPERLSGVIDLLIKNGTNWDPTMTVYEDNRDLWRAAGIPVKETLMHPSEIAAGPDSSSHGAFKTEWKTSDEINWKRNFGIWMRWVKTFHERGGLLTAGSDEGGIGGIALIRELELLQETGIHPIDVIKVATTNAYQTIGLKDFCGVRVGCKADLAVVNGNPIDNFKVMYGRGYGFYGLVPRAEQWKHGGVAWTIKDGILFDAQALLREAEWYVEQEKARLKGKAVTSNGAP